MKLKISTLQFVSFFRSIFLDYKAYATELCNLFLDSTPAIMHIQNFNMLPDDYTLYTFNDKKGFRITIAKSRTDIFYSPNEEEYEYNEVIDNFSSKITVFVNKFYNKYTLCSRIGFINEVMVGCDDPQAIIRNNLLKESFYKNAQDINLNFNRKDIFQSLNINDVVNIYSQQITSNEQNDIATLFVKEDINTSGFQENISKDFIINFLNNYSEFFKKDAMEGIVNGQF